MLRDNFFATVLEESSAVSRQQSVVSETRATTSQKQQLDADQFVHWLIGRLSDVDQIERTRFRILRIEKLDASPESWSARLLLSVTGRNQSDKPLSIESEHFFEFRFHDHEEIGQQTLLERWNVESDVRNKSRRRLMEEVTEQAGLSSLPIHDNWKVQVNERTAYGLQIAVEDFDRDGFLDIAVGTLHGRPFLLRSVGGKQYENVATSLGVKSWKAVTTALVAWIDYDNDGYPDLIMGDRLYQNQEGKRFVDVTAASGIRFQNEPMGCTVVDYDSDGLLDLYVLYQYESEEQSKKSKQTKQKQPLPWVGDDTSGSENALWRNVGNGRFKNVTAESAAGGGSRHSFAAVWFFHDDDHHADLYVVNDFGQNVLLRNKGNGTFEDITQSTGIGDFATSMGVAAGDLNNDGTTELYVANMYSKMGRRIIAQVGDADYPAGIYRQIQGSCAGNRLYRRNPGESIYHEVSDSFGVNAVGWAHAPTMADFDGDGWLDMYATTGFMSFNRHDPDG